MSEKQILFVSRVRALVDQVRGWGEANEWATKEYPKKMRNEERQIFELPALMLQKGPVRVLLDPVAYDIPGTEAVVDLYLMPGYDDTARFQLREGIWTIDYAFPESGSVMESESLALSEKCVIQVLDSIATHAEPSF